MKYFSIIILSLFLSCNNQPALTSSEILEKSIQKHDPDGNFKNLSFKLRVQEPRLQNPERFSIVSLNNITGEFELQRDRETHVSRHIIDKNNIAKTLFDNEIETDTFLIRKFRLDPKRNFIYRRYYQSFSMLPMSLQTEKHILKESVEKVTFNEIPAFKISLELEEPMWSNNWNIFFSQDDFTFLGGEVIFPDDPSKGERIYFDGYFTIAGVSFSRYHHWHELNGKYLGSDIFVKELE